MSERLSVADARTAIVNGRDEDLQVNMDALLAARDAEWRAAVERVRRDVPDTIDGVCQVCGRYSSYCPCFDHNAALDALIREVPHDGQ